jgi:hypothetical protein
VAFLVCGSLNTLVDNPRFLWLLLVVAWLAMLERPPMTAPSRRTARASQRGSQARPPTAVEA